MLHGMCLINLRKHCGIRTRMDPSSHTLMRRTALLQ
jgi:hypothetical protein